MPWTEDELFKTFQLVRRLKEVIEPLKDELRGESNDKVITQRVMGVIVKEVKKLYPKMKRDKKKELIDTFMQRVRNVVAKARVKKTANEAAG